MKNKKSVWIFGGIILMTLFVFGVFWVSPFSTKALSEQELKTTALSKYPGEIIRTAKAGNTYEIDIQMENGIYAIKMDAKKGSILSLEQMETEEDPLPTGDRLTEDQIKKEIANEGELQSIQLVDNTDTPYYEAVIHKENNEVTLKLDPYNGDVIDSTETPVKPSAIKENTLLTEQEALTIAANHLKGVADEDAELHQPAGQTPYYLVEVEIENGEEEDREAVVEIDAYTGTVKSIDWED